MKQTMRAALAVAVAGAAALLSAAASADDGNWASIAYSQKTGNYGFSTNQMTEDDARKKALEKIDAPDAAVLKAFDSGWAALVAGKDDKCAVVTAKDEHTVRTRAVEDAKKKGVEDCRLVLVIQSRGYVWCKGDQPPGDHVIAIARSDKNPAPGWGTAINDTQEEAEKNAAESAGGDKDAVKVSAKNGWCAMAEGPNGGWGLGAGDTEDHAKEQALAAANKLTKKARVMLLMCSDGRIISWPDCGVAGGGSVH